MSLQHLKHHLAEADVSVLLWHSTCCGHDVRALWWERPYKKGRLQTLPWHPFRVTRMVSIGEEGSTPGKSGSQHFCDCGIPSFWRPHQVLFPGCVPSVYQREGKTIVVLLESRHISLQFFICSQCIWTCLKADCCITPVVQERAVYTWFNPSMWGTTDRHRSVLCLLLSLKK